MMSVEKHTLLQDFPDHHHTIRHLKMHDRHFARLFDEYHELDHKVRRFETGVEHTTDEDVHALKTQRVNLKDELFAMVQKTDPNSSAITVKARYLATF
jgi:uncharacterized protein YdcH (DUF465 family)